MPSYFVVFQKSGTLLHQDDVIRFEGESDAFADVTRADGTAGDARLANTLVLRAGSIAIAISGAQSPLVVQ